MMITIERIRHKIVFKVSPSDMHAKVRMEKMMVPMENPIILIGQRLPLNAS